MFISRSAHEALLNAKDAQLSERNHRIVSLESEVSFLRALIRPEESRAGRLLNMEANAILEGRQDQIDGADEPTKEEIISERDRMLSGQY